MIDRIILKNRNETKGRKRTQSLLGRGNGLKKGAQKLQLQGRYDIEIEEEGKMYTNIPIRQGFPSPKIVLKRESFSINQGHL